LATSQLLHPKYPLAANRYPAIDLTMPNLTLCIGLVFCGLEGSETGETQKSMPMGISLSFLSYTYSHFFTVKFESQIQNIIS